MKHPTYSQDHVPCCKSVSLQECCLKSWRCFPYIPVTMFSLEEGQQWMFLFCFLCIVSSRQRQTLPWWKMLIKEVKRHIADFNSEPCFSALVTACHVIPILLYILLMSRILHGEAEFIFLWLTGQKSLLCQYYLSYSEGSQGRESLCALVKSRMLFFSLSKNRLKSCVSYFLGPNVEFI